MPEVERPEALQGCKANRAFISQECGAEQGIVRFLEGLVWDSGFLCMVSL